MPKVKEQALTAAKVKTIKEPGAYADGNGLTLKVDASGNRRWYQRIRVNGMRRNVGLGTYPVVGLKEARKAALANLLEVQQGGNPIDQKRRAREDAQRPVVPTFQQAAAKVIEMRRPAWSSNRHAKQWVESLTLHAYPVIGRKLVDGITTADVMAVLTPIWTAKPETARRVRQRIETILDYSIAEGWRLDNPAGKAVACVFPKVRQLQQHHPALPYTKVPAALQQVRESTADTVTKLAFEFMVLTAARPGEVRGAEWSEIDLETATWTVPAARMKARREHRVPLSNGALAILKEAKGLSDGKGLIFPNRRSGKPISNMGLTRMLERLEISAVSHGFRSSFKDWTMEETSTSWAVAESALAHNLGNSTEVAYARSDLFVKRRFLMEQWDSFLASGGDSASPCDTCTFRPRSLRTSLDSWLPATHSATPSDTTNDVEWPVFVL